MSHVCNTTYRLLSALRLVADGPRSSFGSFAVSDFSDFYHSLAYLYKAVL